MKTILNHAIFHNLVTKNRTDLNYVTRTRDSFEYMFLKVAEQVRGCIAQNHPHGRVILGKCLNLYIILKLIEPRTSRNCYLLAKFNIKFSELQSVKCK